MLALKALLAVLLLCCCGLGPGLVVVRRLRSWWPLERLCAAVGISLFVIYLAAAIIYGLGWSRWACYAVSGACLVLLAASAGDLYAMLRSTAVRRALLWLGLLVGWSLAALAVIRHYSGGDWEGDWLEHYQRILFFVGQFPHDRLFLNIYELPARPPMMNLLGAFVMAQVGTEFPIYQVVFCFLNSLIFLPCVLMAPLLARRGGRRVALVGLLFALNPMFIQNVTYPWTKLLGGFYTVLAVWLYLRGVRKGDLDRIVLAVACLAVGLLVHYSVAVFAIVLGAHYFIFVFRKRRRKRRELLLSGAAGLLILATWLGWSLREYGWRSTVGSNTTVTDASRLSAWGNVKRTGNNLLHSLLPHPVAGAPTREKILKQTSRWGYWRDYAFLVYQTNALVAMGSIGGIVVLALLIRRLWGRGADRDQRRFWLMFVVLGFVLGVVVVGKVDYYGVAHLCLQPAVLIGLTFLAVNLPSLPGAVLAVWAAATAFDFATGVLLHLSMENLTVQRFVVQDNDLIIDLNAVPINTIARGSLGSKIISGLGFWGDQPLAFFQLALGAACVVMLGWILKLARTRGPAARPGAVESPTGTTSGSAAARP